MDFLAVAAAAGAGYVAKYLHKISKQNDGESSLDSTNTAAQARQEWDKTCSSNDIVKRCNGSYAEVGSSAGNVNVGRLMNIGESTSVEGLGDVGRYEDSNPLSLASLPHVLDKNEKFQLGSVNLGENELRENFGEVDFAHRFHRSRSIRSRKPYSNFAKPLNSLESCTAQLYIKHSAMENCIPTPLPSPSTRIRLLLVTDGKRVISRATSDFEAGLRFQVDKRENGILFGVPPLRKRSTEVKKRPKQSNREKWYTKVSSSSATADAEPFNPQGSPCGMLLFLIGVTIGILSTAVANKREVDNLSELLKQSKNLVQDLQEEIEMKDSMTVKELISENVRIQESDGNNASLEDPTTRIENLVDSEKDCSKEDDQNAKQSDIMSQIEAELEAELERLELNMKGSTLERISDFVELDPDYEADVTTGEFKIDTISKQPNKDSDLDEDNQDGTSTGHTDHANRPVSPRELSLRLHEVIEARLEARILELETALEDSQRRVHSLEHSGSKPRTCFEKGFASPESSAAASHDEENNFDQPLVINLAGDALDAYNEAYEEIFRMVKTEDETPPDTTFNVNLEEPKAVPSQSQSMPDMSFLQNISIEDRSPIASTERINWQEQLSENIESGDESEGDDILGKLLIQQIVEKSRQGSPLVLNAQRILYSMDE